MRHTFSKGNSYAGKPSIEKKCEFCSKTFRAYQFSINKGNGKFCSMKCYATSRVGQKLSEERVKNISLGHIGTNTWMKGKKLPKEWIENIKRGTKGKTFTLETRKKLSDAHKGEKSRFWRGGITATNRVIRNSLEYRLWREAVYKRDDYTCQICGEKGGRLNVDHIKPFALYPELRTSISNGRTLCHECHKMTETYGVPFSKLKQIA